MARTREQIFDVLGNLGLTHFDFCVIGSGAGGASAAHVLAAAGKNVLVLEAGHNPFPGLDQPGAIPPPLHSNDELKYAVRGYLETPGLLSPRTFRTAANQPARILGDVNALPQALGGAFQHADMKTPRFNVVDFELRSHVESRIGSTPGLQVPGFGSDAASANFADWPFSYADLEPFYVEAETLYGVAGTEDDPFASWRSAPYPMPPGNPMYHSLLLAEGARNTPFLDGFLHPHSYPTAINSRPYDGRPACNDCGPCSGFGCPSHAKGSPAVTALRRALLTDRCQVRFNARALFLANDGGHVDRVLYRDDDGTLHTAVADAFLLAASPIESARLCLISQHERNGAALGNSSDQVGRNLMFHLQTLVNGFMPQRVHGQRGRAVTHGLSDTRGVEPGGESVRIFDDGGTPRIRLGGIVEFGCPQGLAITDDAFVMAFDLQQTGAALRYGLGLKNALRDGALAQHLVSTIMQAEDAPQLRNRVDLDPTVKDVFGYPVARVTYKPHAFEVQTRLFYEPILKQVLENAGATRVFLAPCSTLLRDPPDSRHVLGTLRMGTDPATSVTNGDGRFHDVDNLYACDGSVFPTSSGYNPTLTIIATALKIAHGLAGT
jgi:gluconate 2-dehydrogenase alpha chain